VTSIADRKRLFDQVARLRRAERAMPQNRDVAAVRAELEAELGEAISQRLAAALLGVSHTSIRRWIRRGDVPVVHTPSGTLQLPVAAVLDLYDAVERDRKSGRRRHVLEPSMVEGRERARRIAIAPPDQPLDRHEAAAQRSLAYHRVLADRLRRSNVNEALHLVWAWRAQGKIDEVYAERWEQVLRQPLPEVRRAITEDSQQGRDLRQNSPFAGMLSEPERREVFRRLAG
jgi:hypothetical protein